MRFVVRPHRPLRQFVLGVACVLLTTLAGWLLYDHGHWRVIHDRMSATSEQRDLRSLSRTAEADNALLRGRVTTLERAAQIDREAYLELQRLAGELQDDNLLLKEEIEFYRNVLAAGDKGQGLKLQAMHLQALDKPAEFRFQAVLTRVAKDDNLARGTMVLSIEGQRGGHSIMLGLAAITPNRAEKLPFQFKHFHRIEGTFALPAGFKPTRVRVVLTEANRQRPTAIETFEWHEIIEPKGEEHRHVGKTVQALG
ncbi:MAG: DUF6776 family protein [Gammaproteobacteria bacterium]